MNVLNMPKKYNSLVQAINLIYKQEGFNGLFKGYATTSLLIPLNYVIYFDLYERFKVATRKFTGKENSVICFAIPSILSGLITNIALCPLWVIRTRKQASIYHSNADVRVSMFKMISEIYHKVPMCSYPP